MKTEYKKIQICLSLAVLLAIQMMSACRDFIDIDAPRTEIVSQSVFESDASAMSAIRGIYSLMMTNNSFTKGAIEEYTGIASDELINYSSSLNRMQFYQNSIAATNGDLASIFWTEAYKYINNANAIIEALPKSTGMTASGKKQLEGEAKFIRAFCHFYLAALFGDVPYISTTDYALNAKASREPYQNVLSKIETDLLDARQLLATDFSYSSGERIQPNKGAATAFLARVYLYQGNWEKAESMATEVIGNVTYALQGNLNNVFLANSVEAIWQLKPVVPNTNAPQAQVFLLTTMPNGISKRVSMTAGLTNAFETNDQRKIKWTASVSSGTGSWGYFFKYKVALTTLSEYSMVFRLAEQYLIRAEARVHLSNVEGAKSDLNVIRNRAGLPNTATGDQNTMLIAIEKERRVEFFGEFGHRWLDLKRTQRIDAVMSLIKPQWQTTDKLFPIPNSERLLDPNLSQNEGY